MSRRERDTISAAQAFDIGNIKGVLIKIKERQHLIQPITHSGQLWMDIKSAHELNLVPNNYEVMSDDDITEFLRKSIIGQKILVTSYVKIELPDELEKEITQLKALLKN